MRLIGLLITLLTGCTSLPVPEPQAGAVRSVMAAGLFVPVHGGFERKHNMQQVKLTVQLPARKDGAFKLVLRDGQGGIQTDVLDDNGAMILLSALSIEGRGEYQTPARKDVQRLAEMGWPPKVDQLLRCYLESNRPPELPASVRTCLSLFLRRLNEINGNAAAALERTGPGESPFSKDFEAEMNQWNEAVHKLKADGYDPDAMILYA